MKIYHILKKAYFLLPFKRNLFSFLRKVYKPSLRLSGYLKFRGFFHITVDSKQLAIYNNNSTLASFIFWKGIEGYERCSLNTWIELSKKVDVIFDIGANFGLYGLLSKSVNPHSTVYFFEPLRRNCDLIEKNIYSNHFEKTEVECMALSDSNGIMDFFDMESEENTIGSLDKEFVKSHTHAKTLVKIQVHTKTLDFFIGEKNIEKIDLLKIDVEGAELLVLRGFKENIKKYTPDIIIEIGKIETVKEIQNLLETLNLRYNYYEIDEQNGLKKTDSLFSAKGKNFLFTLKSI
jgi:FkbM family methyltransferase